MLFNSVHYFIFAPLVIGFYFVLPEKAKRWWMLLASLYFYGIFRIAFLLLLFLSVTFTYIAAIGIEDHHNRKVKGAFLILAIGVNLGLLYVFKYLDFSLRAFNALGQLTPCSPFYAQAVGILLPLGISFFTLQSIAYAVDVYRGELRATRNIVDYTLFISFFPQLVAGPIMRAKDLMHQFQEKHPFQVENLKAGLLLIAAGIFKKTFVADRAGELVDTVFQNPSQYDWLTMWISVFLHTLQIYGDFSGYSDIAIGTGKILGFQIPLNFERPLLAESVTDIWRRWHISLSTWLRDYIYIPLGGSRVSPFRSYMNLAITWLVAGIWHGADWTFLLWGLVNAVAIMGERVLFRSRSLKSVYFKLPRFLRSFYAVGVFSFALFFFRAHPVAGFHEGYQVSFYMIMRAFTFAPGELLLPAVPVILLTLILLLLESAQEWSMEWMKRLEQNRVIPWVAASALILVSGIVYSVSVSPQFIYFQF